MQKYNKQFIIILLCSIILLNFSKNYSSQKQYIIQKKTFKAGGIIGSCCSSSGCIIGAFGCCFWLLLVGFGSIGSNQGVLCLVHKCIPNLKLSKTTDFYSCLGDISLENWFIGFVIIKICMIIFCVCPCCMWGMASKKSTPEKSTPENSTSNREVYT
jgi:hypothetical protein